MTKTFFISIFSIALFIAILSYIFTGSDFSQTKPEVFKNKLGYYSIQVKTWYNKSLYFDLNQAEERNVFVIPELHNKGYILFTKDKAIIEQASLWIVYRELLEKETSTLARSKNERIN